MFPFRSSLFAPLSGLLLGSLFALLVASLFLLLYPPPWRKPALRVNRQQRRLMQCRGWTLAAVSGSPFLLCACGTAPLQVQSCPPVPAGLMTPPQQPALLKAMPASWTPSATRLRTPPAAASTVATTSA